MARSSTESAISYVIDFDTETPVAQASIIESAMEKVRARIESIGNSFINYKNRLTSSIQAIGEAVSSVYSNWKTKISSFFSGTEFNLYTEKLKRFSQMMFGYGEAWEEHKATVSETLALYEESLGTLTGMEKVWVNIKLKVVSYWAKLIEVGQEQERRIEQLERMDEVTGNWRDKLKEVMEVTKNIAIASPAAVGAVLMDKKIRSIGSLLMKGYTEEFVKNAPLMIDAARQNTLNTGRMTSSYDEYEEATKFLGEKRIKPEKFEGRLTQAEEFKRVFEFGDLKSAAEWSFKLNKQMKIAPERVRNFAAGLHEIGSQAQISFQEISNLMDQNEDFFQQMREGDPAARKLGIQLTAVAGAFKKAGIEMSELSPLMKSFREGWLTGDTSKLGVFGFTGADAQELKQLTESGNIGEATLKMLEGIRRTINLQGPDMTRLIMEKAFGQKISPELIDRLVQNNQVELDISKLMKVGGEAELSGKIQDKLLTANERVEAASKQYTLIGNRFGATWQRLVYDPLATKISQLSQIGSGMVNKADGSPAEGGAHLGIGALLAYPLIKGLLPMLKFGSEEKAESDQPQYKDGRLLVDTGEKGGGGIFGAIGKMLTVFFSAGMLTKIFGLSPIKKIIFETGTRFFGKLAANAFSANKSIGYIWGGIAKIFNLFTGPSLLSKIWGFFGKFIGFAGRFLGVAGLAVATFTTFYTITSKLRDLLNNWTGGKFDEWVRKVSPLFIAWKYIVDKIYESKSGGQNFGIGTSEEKANKMKEALEVKRRGGTTQTPIIPNPSAQPSHTNQTEQVQQLASSHSKLNEKLEYVKNTYGSLTEKYGKQYGVDPNLLQAVIMQESGGNPNAVSKAGARGLTQFMPKTGPDFGLNTEEDFFNPEKSIEASAKYFNWLGKKYNYDEEKMLAFYNAGGKTPKVFGGEGNPESDAYAPSVQAHKRSLEGSMTSFEIPRESRTQIAASHVPASVSPESTINVNQSEVVDVNLRQLTVLESMESILKERGIITRPPDGFRDFRTPQQPTNNNPDVRLIAEGAA